MPDGEKRSRNAAPASTAPAQSIFIDVEVSNEIRGDADLASKLEEACPVDIFKANGGVEVVERNLDECILCGLCVEAAPPGGVRVVKRYDEGAALER